MVVGLLLELLSKHPTMGLIQRKLSKNWFGIRVLVVRLVTKGLTTCFTNRGNLDGANSCIEGNFFPGTVRSAHVFDSLGFFKFLRALHRA